MLIFLEECNSVMSEREVLQGAAIILRENTKFYRETFCFVSECKVSLENTILWWQIAKALKNIIIPPISFFFSLSLYYVDSEAAMFGNRATDAASRHAVVNY